MHRDLRVPDHRAREQCEADRDDRPRPEPRRQGLRDSRGDDGRARGRDERDAGLQSRIAEDVLHIEGEQEEVGEDHRTEKQTDDVCARDRTHAEDVERHQRVVNTTLVDEKSNEQCPRSHEQENRPRGRPAHIGRSRDGVDEQGQAPADEDRAEGVVAPLGAFALAFGDNARRQGEHQRTDRHVDEEDPFPAQVLRQHAAGEHPDRRAAAAERTPDSQSLVSLSALLEARHHDRERGRRDDGAAESLHRSSHDQHPLG